MLTQLTEQLASATDLSMVLKVVVGLVKELTGFHRVMIYQFDDAWNGQVVTELVDPRATKDLYKGNTQGTFRGGGERSPGFPVEY